MTNLTPVDILVTRTWNNTPISRRTADGYVNATAMCKANGKEWSNYYKSERTSQYLQALQGSLPNGGHLVQVIGTGPNEGRGTYVHPRLAVDLLAGSVLNLLYGWMAGSLRKLWSNRNLFLNRCSSRLK
jgi:hypothetical protein